MLAEIFPRLHARYSALPLLGPHLDGFVDWLVLQGYPRLPIRLRVRAAKALDASLLRDGVGELEQLSAERLLAYAPVSSQDDIYRSALVRSLARYLDERGILGSEWLAPTGELTRSYCTCLEDLRGFSASTVHHHAATVREFLAHLGNEEDGQLDDRLHSLDSKTIEDFIGILARRLGRESLQHAVSHLRSFLRFLAARDLAPDGLATSIETPRVYRGERLPRALAWEQVRALLDAIDCSTPMGRRDYAMLLLVATYGLRSCEVVSLKLDDIAWREQRVCIARPKVGSPLQLPLTPEVGAAILAYLQNGRPPLSYREVFLRARAPAGTLKPTALTEVFQGWVRRSGLAIPFQGPHCLRHSVAVHLLRRGISLKAIADLLGHRSTESTCVYLRLHTEDLREVALPLPANAGLGGQP